MTDPYLDREQTKAKHFILRHYLQALAFKVLRNFDVTYVDGFSGPWQTKTADFSDTSFMIAINVLKDAQRFLFEKEGVRRPVKCFFVEDDASAFASLQRAVAPHHRPEDKFIVQARLGKFEDAIGEIQTFIGASFPLIFIDPTGWKGYDFDKIGPLFQRRKCEVLINFMYDFINRFVSDDREGTIGSLEPILGGPGWRNRLDPDLPPGPATEKLCRESLKSAGRFLHVVSTKIDKPTADRPHFFLIYGTKDWAGLKAFRQTEYEALRQHARERAGARERKRQEKSGSSDLFPDYDAELQEATIDQIVDEQIVRASADALAILSKHGSMKFRELASILMESFMLRETNIKTICAKLAKNGQIENTWGGGNRKPQEDDLIRRSR